MPKINELKKGIEISSNVINEIMFLYDFRTKSTYFTRIGKSKMKFNSIILFILNFIKNNLQLELDDFFKKIKKIITLLLNKVFHKLAVRLHLRLSYIY